jgi:flagellar biosynthesis protein FlhB
MILMLIAGFFLVIFFLVGIIEALLTGDYLLFVGGIIFLVLFLLVGTVARRFQPAWEKLEETMGLKPKTRRESITEVLPLFISLFVAIVFTFVFESYLLSFPQVISPQSCRGNATVNPHVRWNLNWLLWGSACSVPLGY